MSVCKDERPAVPGPGRALVSSRNDAIQLSVINKPVLTKKHDSNSSNSSYRDILSGMRWEEGEREAPLLAFGFGFSLHPLIKGLQEENGRTGVGHSVPPKPSLSVKVEPDCVKLKGRYLLSEIQGRTTKALVSMQITGFLPLAIPIEETQH